MVKKTTPLYADLNKRTSDLLTKDFPAEKQENKFSWKGQTENEVIVETTLTQKKDGSVLGTFFPKYKQKDWRTTFSAELNTKKEMKGEVQIEDVFNVDGLKTNITIQQAAGPKSTDPFQTFGTTALEFRNENLSATGSVDFGKSEGSLAKASAVCGTGSVAVGGSASYHLGTSELKESQTSLIYFASDFDLSAFGRIKNGEGKSESEIGANYFHKVRSDWSVAAEASVDINNSSKAPKLTFATQYSLDRDTTLKAKVDTDGKVAGSYTQQFNNSKLQVSVAIDANNLATKNGVAYGISYSLWS